MDEETLKVVHAPTLQKLADSVKASVKKLNNPELTIEAKGLLMHQFLEGLDSLLAIQTDAVMNGATRHKIDSLTQECLNSLTTLGEQGADCQGAVEALKNTCIYFLRRKREEEACQATEACKFIGAWHKEKRSFVLETMGMLACVALKSKLNRLGLQCVDVILAIASHFDGEAKEAERVALDSLKSIASMAGRMRDEATFNAVVSKGVVHFSSKKSVQVGEQLMSLLIDLMFVAADRRYIDALPMLRWLSLLLVQDKQVGRSQKAKFLNEWGILAAQMARREWKDVTKMLLDGICIFLNKERDFELTKGVMNSISTHFQMQAKRDGFANAFATYRSWHNFVIVALDKCINGKEGEAVRLEGARFIMRNQRDMFTATARLAMVQEYEIYNQWLKLWLTELAQNPKRQKRARRFVQMTVQYWHMTQPLSSKKQWGFVQEVFEPNCLDQKYWQLLKKIV